jgi:hypothetical protein
MVTGSECVGLVPAILLLVIEAGKAYASVVNAVADIMVLSGWDQKNYRISTATSYGR